MYGQCFGMVFCLVARKSFSVKSCLKLNVTSPSASIPSLLQHHHNSFTHIFSSPHYMSVPVLTYFPALSGIFLQLFLSFLILPDYWLHTYISTSPFPPHPTSSLVFSLLRCVFPSWLYSIGYLSSKSLSSADINACVVKVVLPEYSLQTVSHKTVELILIKSEQDIG